MPLTCATEWLLLKEVSINNLLGADQAQGSCRRFTMPVAITREGVARSAVISCERHGVCVAHGPQKHATIAGGPAATPRYAVCTLPVVDRAVPALRAFVRDAATRWGLSEETVYTLRVIATELVANVLRHSGSPDVTLLVAVDRPMVTIQVSDSGRWRERCRASRAPNEEAEDGRGLSLVRAYAARCRIDKTSRGTTVCVEVEEEPPAPAAHIA